MYGASKIETIKAWSMNTYKCTKQMISERYGKLIYSYRRPFYKIYKMYICIYL